MAHIAFPNERKNASTHQLQGLVKTAKDDVFKKAGIPAKYWPLLRKLDKVRDKQYLYMNLAHLECSSLRIEMSARTSHLTHLPSCCPRHHSKILKCIPRGRMPFRSFVIWLSRRSKQMLLIRCLSCYNLELEERLFRTRKAAKPMWEVSIEAVGLSGGEPFFFLCIFCCGFYIHQLSKWWRTDEVMGYSLLLFIHFSCTIRCLLLLKRFLPSSSSFSFFSDRS